MVRISGPGTRRKNPAKYDKFGRENDMERVPLGDGTRGHLAKVRARLDARMRDWQASTKNPRNSSAAGQRQPGSMRLDS